MHAAEFKFRPVFRRLISMFYHSPRPAGAVEIDHINHGISVKGKDMTWG